VPLPGRPFALTIDKVYGTFTVPSFGWPWGWARLWNIAQPRRPHIIGEYKILQNTACLHAGARRERVQLLLVAQPDRAVEPDLRLLALRRRAGARRLRPGQPQQADWFSPTPLASVANEDPALSAGANKVVIWSFPIIRNGLIYVVDIRNGLYVLRYTGLHADEVDGISFLEGNSNLGDAQRLAQSAAPYDSNARAGIQCPAGPPASLQSKAVVAGGAAADGRGLPVRKPPATKGYFVLATM
jgi:hypothetical protein